MTIDKAIERLEVFVERHPGPGYSDLIPSIKLGIEALKEIQHLHVSQVLGEDELLPGETED